MNFQSLIWVFEKTKIFKYYKKKNRKLIYKSLKAIKKISKSRIESQMLPNYYKEVSCNYQFYQRFQQPISPSRLYNEKVITED